MDVSFMDLKRHFYFVPCFHKDDMLVAMVDRVDVDLVRSHRWDLVERFDGLLTPVCKIDGKQRYMRHMIAELAYGPRPEGHVCEHLNGDHMDLRRCNLKYSPKYETQYYMQRHALELLSRPDGCDTPAWA